MSTRFVIVLAGKESNSENIYRRLDMKKRIWTVLMACLLVGLLGTSFAEISSNFELYKYEAGVELNEVKLIQIALINDDLLEADHITSRYDSETEKAVLAFQKKYDLTADGVAGTETLNKMTTLELFPVLTKDIYKNGMEDPEVINLQRALKAEGYLDVNEYTTYYGMLTVEAVKAFQKDHNMVADGIIGIDTVALLSEMGYALSADENTVTAMAKMTVGNLSKPSYRNGTNHSDVITIQKVLDAEGCFDYDGYTTYYGSVTEKGVKAFQAKYGIEADGVVGKTTIKKFVELGYVTNDMSVSRGVGSKQYGEIISWYDIRGTFTRGETVLKIEDFYTGRTFDILVTYGTNHADVEPLTAQDSATVKSLWGGEFGWDRRPVLVHYNGEVYAGSMNGMPHAGLENKPEGEYVSNRSGNFGYGYNMDLVKGNNVDGVICLHFKDSKLHAGNKSDARHQQAVRIAAGLE